MGVIWICALVLGYIGFYEYSMAAGENKTGRDLLYRSLQLILLASGDMEGTVPWKLEVARFLMPAMAAYAAIQALIVIFSKQWQLLRIRFLKNHVVVCGLGERGLRLVREFSDHGYKVVVIEENKENPLIDQCQKYRAIILSGDATSKSRLRKSRIHKAKYLVSVCADDGTNAEIVLKARDIVLFHKGYDLTSFVHIEDLELCNLLKEWELDAEAGSFRLEFFNVPERGARLMLRMYSPLKKEFDREKSEPRILIVGLGKMGRSLIVQAAGDWWMKQTMQKKRLRITVIDKAAESKVELLRLRYPKLDKVCDIDVLQIEMTSPEFERGDFLYDNQGQLDVAVIYICFDDDVHVLVCALTLFRKTKEYKVPIITRMSQEGGLATLIRKGYHVSDFENIHTFGLLDKTCNLDALLGGTHEVIARAIHEEYLRHQKEAGEATDIHHFMVDWDDLSEDLKKSNRSQADHIEVKMNAVGCGIQPLTDWEAASFEFLPEEIELMAELEHERWYEERRQKGWSYAPGGKNIKKKTSPHLVSWDDLSGEIKEYDRNMVRNFPSFLAQAGFQIYRRVYNDRKNEFHRPRMDAQAGGRV